MKKLGFALMLVCAIAFVVVTRYEFFPSQISILLLTITIFSMSMCAMIKNAFVKYLCIAIFSISLPLMVLEVYYAISLNKSQKIGQFAKVENVTIERDVTEYDPNEEYIILRAKRVMPAQNITLYDAVYTTSFEGRRVTPYAPNAKTAVVLLGCSFTFGDGLNDEQTFAYKLGKNLGPEYQVYNLGLSGTGSHRILSALEASIPKLKNFQKVMFYYVAIDDHVRRAAGAVSWDNNGPFYKIEDGLAVRAGTFADTLPFYRRTAVYDWVSRSSLYKKIHYRIDILFAPYPDTEDQLALQGALMHSMQNVIKNNYISSTFRVLLWPPNTDKTFPPLLKDIPYIDLKTWFTDYDKEIGKYVIAYPEEVHPSAYANDIVANKLTQVVLSDAKSLQ